MTITQEAFRKTANTIINNLSKRNIEGYFFENSNECIQYIQTFLAETCTVSWGGSETLKESGMINCLKSGSYQLIDYSQGHTEEEKRSIYSKIVMSDFFFMSSNAITVDGELINIDGNANRLSCLLHGPKHVMILIGMNKITSDIKTGIERIQTYACPANAQKLQKSTPCGIHGICDHCLSPDCMCNQIVITRHSRHNGRIKVFLIAENLGY